MPDFNALLLQGLQTGRELRRQEGEANALAGLFGTNGGIGYGTAGIGDDINNRGMQQEQLGELARYNPKMALEYQKQNQTQVAAQQKAQEEKLKQAKSVVGQAALQIATLPPEQQPQAWDQQIDYLVGQGYDGLAPYKGKYSPQSLMGVISEAGLANELRTATQPSYQVIPEGGALVNTRDPRATQQFAAPGGQPAPQQQPQPSVEPVSAQEASTMLQSSDPQTFLKWQQRFNIPVRVSTPEEAAAMPAGTIIMSPDGRTKVKQ